MKWKREVLNLFRKQKGAMMSEFYEVTSDQIMAYHERCAEDAEKEAEKEQAKLEKIPVEARDACNQGRLQHMQREGEAQRALAGGVGAGVYKVSTHDYLRITREKRSYNLEGAKVETGNAGY